MNYIFADTEDDAEVAALGMGLNDWGTLHSPHLVGPESVIWECPTAYYRQDYSDVISALRLRGHRTRRVPGVPAGAQVGPG